MGTAPRARFDGRSTIVLAFAVLVSLHVVWQMWLVAAAPYPARYDYDEGVYAETAAAAAAGNRLYASVFLSQPPLLIEVLAHAFRTFGRSLGAGRGVLVAFSVLWLVGVAAIAARGGRPRAAVWAVAIAGSTPALVTASHTIQMEGASEALAALAVALGLPAHPRANAGATSASHDVIRWGLAGLAAGLAVMTKFTAATSLVALAVIIAAEHTRPAGRPAARAAALAAGALLAAAAVAAWSGSPARELWRQTVTFHSTVARVTALDPGRTASLLRDFAAANWLLTALGLAGLVYTVRMWRGTAVTSRPIPAAAVTAWLAADLAALFLWKPVWAHHLVILVTPLGVLGAVAAEAVWRARRAAAGMLVVCWLAAVWGTVAAVVPENSGSVRAAVLQTKRMVPEGGWIVADDPMISFLAGRDAPPALCDTSEMRVRAGSLTGAALTAALDEPWVRGVVLWRGTFGRAFPVFLGAASQRFPRRWMAGGGREILAR